MKKILLTLTLLFVLSSCNQKKTTEKQEVQEQKTEATIAKENSKNDINGEIYKTKTGMVFTVDEEKTSASISKITIIPSGFEEVNEIIQMEESDPISRTYISDLNNDGFDELYIITKGVGSGSYGNIYGYASNKDKSVTSIYFPEITEKDLDGYFKGYMGHDSIYITNNELYRKFPIYKEGDENCCPTGGNKTIRYKLKAGEASWQLEMDK
jgi:hypothetical protein